MMDATDTATIHGPSTGVHCGPVASVDDVYRDTATVARHDGRTITTWTADEWPPSTVGLFARFIRMATEDDG